LRPELAMEFYCDESCQNGHRFLVIGVMALFKDAAKVLRDELAQIRNENNHHREMGWTCVGKYKFHVYQAWVDLFRQYAARGQLRYTALVLDTRQIDKAIWSGDSDIGFNKLIYQLLLHRVGKRYGADRTLRGYLDSRTTSHSPETLLRMLNAGLAKLGIRTNPFHALQFQKSDECDLVQLTDIVTGAVGLTKNQQAQRVQKYELALQVMRAAKRPTSCFRFDIWNFQYQHKERHPRT
jgi:hypothetical protein